MMWWPFPGPGPFGGGPSHVGAAILGGLGVVFGMIVATLLLVALVAFLILLVRFLIVGTKAAELYVARHREVGAPTAPAPTPAPTAPAAPTPDPAPDAAPARAPRTRTTTTPVAPRTRAPRPPRT